MNLTAIENPSGFLLTLNKLHLFNFEEGMCYYRDDGQWMVFYRDRWMEAKISDR